MSAEIPKLAAVQCLGCAHTDADHDEAGCGFGWRADATEAGCDCTRTRERLLLEALAWADDD